MQFHWFISLLIFGLETLALDWKILNSIQRKHFGEFYHEHLDMVHLIQGNSIISERKFPVQYLIYPRTIITGNYFSLQVTTFLRFFQRKVVVLVEVGSFPEAVQTVVTNLVARFAISTNIIFIFITNANSIFPTIEILQQMALKTRGILNSYIVLENSRESKYFQHKSGTGKVVSIEENGILIPEFFLRRMYPNFDGAIFASTICPMCNDFVERLNKNEEMSDYNIVALNELRHRVNATIDYQAQFGQVYSGTDENGEWDVFAKPVIEGTAVLSSMILPDPKTYSVMMVTRPLYFSSIIFVYRLPKPVLFSSFLRLHYPFTSWVWASTTVSVLATFLFLHVVASFQVDHPSMCTSLSAVVKPIVDQGGVDSKLFIQGFSGTISKGMIGLWFLLLISLGCAYKSKMIQQISVPTLEIPPTTFTELVETDYSIGATVYSDVIEDRLKSLNTSISIKLQQRITEFEAQNPDCYERIFETKSVCISFNQIIDIFSIRFMVDVRKRRMYKTSNDKMLIQLSAMGISYQYPELYYPLDSILTHLASTGLPSTWVRNQMLHEQSKGQQYALQMVKEKKYYSGEIDLSENSGEFSFLLLQILCLGSISSITGMFLELLSSWYHKKNRVEIFLTT